jgi:hypothetical protein
VKEETKFHLKFAGVVATFFAAGLCLVGFSAYMQSETYNKLTGAKTTWWDAIWVELRVQDNPK